MIDEERIKRSFSDQVRQLSTENQRLQQVINQRSVNVAVEFVEGLGILLQQAAAGDPSSRQVVSMLRDRLKQLEGIVAGIVLARS